MSNQSVVYGCIKVTLPGNNPEDVRKRRAINRSVLTNLPPTDEWPLLSCDMFSLPSDSLNLDVLTSDVLHFGHAYHGIEHEWDQWIERFEAVLRQMYWETAVVHLETELRGTHTFVWVCEEGDHRPDQGRMSVRCEWTREANTF
jgi:hypothetical protein